MTAWTFSRWFRQDEVDHHRCSRLPPQQIIACSVIQVWVQLLLLSICTLVCLRRLYVSFTHAHHVHDWPYPPSFFYARSSLISRYVPPLHLPPFWRYVSPFEFHSLTLAHNLVILQQPCQSTSPAVLVRTRVRIQRQVLSSYVHNR